MLQVAVGPYTDKSVVAKKSDYVELRMSVLPSTNLKDTAFLDDLADKLARIYVTGKSKSARRKKRAVGSVAANVCVMQSSCHGVMQSLVTKCNAI